MAGAVWKGWIGAVTASGIQVAGYGDGSVGRQAHGPSTAFFAMRHRPESQAGSPRNGVVGVGNSHSVPRPAVSVLPACVGWWQECREG